jgi:anti-sigma B factor antagonist
MEVHMQLRMNTRIQDGVLVLACAGRIVFGEESVALREAVRNAIEANSSVVLNLAEVNYIDSGGLGTLVALYTTARNAGGALKLANLTKRVGDLLQVTKLVSVFEVFPDEASAVHSFHKQAVA